MMIIVLANENLKMELLAQGVSENVAIHWITEPKELLHYRDADAYIDLLFQNDSERIKLLQQLQPKPILINAVIPALNQLPGDFIRFNGWNTFLKRPVIEAAGIDEKIKSKAEEIFSLFNKKAEWVTDVPGFISARVIAMIINEAWFALSEKVSTKEEIDIAMKLGTNYPYGPFEWSEKIGLKNVYELLFTLSKTSTRYEPAGLLKKEVFK
ncbi:MAG TPA: 3-hydroxyacyl-CoA dehydrogenase family protein [Chitinophagaceae bacterium]|nr:3-hydroxyacyl-CoA dehydrogenase family protein [Chitinophagaceae bacterium]